MPLGLFDLSLVTQTLTAQLNLAAETSRLWDDVEDFGLEYVGLAPDVVRGTPDSEVECRVSVYLFHVTVDKHHRNTYPLGGPAQRTPPQPLALTLYYLLTAYSPTSDVQEQQAMSIALKSLHETPLVTLKIPVDTHEEAFTLTIEPQTVDEVGRLWQAFNAPMRLSAVYRVGVIFLEEPVPKAPDVVRHDPGFLDRPDPRHPETDRDQLQAVPTVPEVEGAVTDATGLATIELPGVGLIADSAEVKIRARSLARVDRTPLGGEFQVLPAIPADKTKTLFLQLPLYTPEGRYLVTVVPSPDRSPLTFALDVPARIVFVRVDQRGLGAFAADDAGFETGVTTVDFGSSPATALVETLTDPPPNRGEFCILSNENAIRLRVPAGTAKGLYFLAVKRGPQKTDFGLWLDVPVQLP